jgi:hypothetical protein
MKSDLTTAVAMLVMAAILIISAAYNLVGLSLQATAQLSTTNTSVTTTEIGANQSATDLVDPGSIENLTSSVEVFPILMQALKSQMNISLNDAITIAIDAVGANSSAITASVGTERGFYVYTVLVIDTDNNIHRVMVDPGNGNVLLSEQIPPLIVSSNILDIPPDGLATIPLPGE